MKFAKHFIIIRKQHTVTMISSHNNRKIDIEATEA